MFLDFERRGDRLDLFETETVFTTSTKLTRRRTQEPLTSLGLTAFSS
jgi:hypothetical protein